jgi:hypothetical protein
MIDSLTTTATTTVSRVDLDQTYHGRPVLKEPAWTVEVPWYLFVGGLAGASSLVTVVAEMRGDPTLGRVSSRLAAMGAIASPALLIADLGRPARFLAMLRLVKITSPLNIGSWVLAAYVPAALTSAVIGPEGGRWWIRRLATLTSGGAGAALCTYTAVLLTNTAIPVWHEARRQLPWLFAASSAAAAGASAALVRAEGPSGRRARRLAVAGAAAELGTNEWMRRHLGPLTTHHDHGPAAAWTKAAKWLTTAGIVTTLIGRRAIIRRAGAAALVAGSLCLRFAVFHAGFSSARDPQHTVASSSDGSVS